MVFNLFGIDIQNWEKNECVKILSLDRGRKGAAIMNVQEKG
jgi:hypothetical protein